MNDTTTYLSSLSETIKVCENLKKEVKEVLAENQIKWQQEMESIIMNIKDNRITEKGGIPTRE